MSTDKSTIVCPHCKGTGSMEATLGTRILISRQMKGLTEQDCASQLAISKSLLKRYESDLNDPSLHNLRQLGKVLGVTPAWLLCGDVS